MKLNMHNTKTTTYETSKTPPSIRNRRWWKLRHQIKVTLILVQILLYLILSKSSQLFSNNTNKPISQFSTGPVSDYWSSLLSLWHRWQSWRMRNDIRWMQFLNDFFSPVNCSIFFLLIWWIVMHILDVKVVKHLRLLTMFDSSFHPPWTKPNQIEIFLSFFLLYKRGHGRTNSAHVWNNTLRSGC